MNTVKCFFYEAIWKNLLSEEKPKHRHKINKQQTGLTMFISPSDTENSRDTELTKPEKKN